MPSKKVLEAKKSIVNALAADFGQAQSIVMAEYRGLTVAEDTEMRASLRKAGVTYQVIKNTLSARAMEQVGLTGLEDVLKGPTAIAYSKDDMIAPAKLLKEYAGKFNRLKIKGGVLEGKAISLEEVERLASIPGQDVLYGQLVFTLLSPITSLAIVLNAIKEKMEDGTESSVSAPEAETEA
ncbi:MAG: 50S ribosomal protein L10 [Ruminococcaceae bacterium]|nr:50S ribosomal protein L10 [Oscillospiraceae bacterium]